jgi:hypothetical protein
VKEALVKYQLASLLALASLAGCAAPTSSDEGVSESAQALSSTPNVGAIQILMSYAPGECLGTAYASTSAGAGAQFWNCATSGDPNWNLVQVSSGVYEIRQADSGLCLVTNGGSVANGTGMILWYCSGQTGSRWTISPSGAGATWTIHSLDNQGQCLDVPWGNSADGTGLQVYGCWGGNMQKFVLAPGVAASLSTYPAGSVYNATLKVTNSSSTNLSNWQVAVRLNGASIQNSPQYGGVIGVSGGSVYYSGGLAIFTPVNGYTLPSGGTATVTFTLIGGSNVSIDSTDGISGTFAPVPNDGVDHVAHAVATSALNVVEAFEKGRTVVDQYDYYLLDSHLYTVSSDGSQLVFDPNAPGYSSIPQTAFSALATAQLDPSVAEYLVAGELSCLTDTSAWEVWGFNGAALRNWSYTTSQQTMNIGVWGSSATDTIQRVGANVGGSERITLTETVASGTNNSFGLIQSIDYGNYEPVATGLWNNKYHGSNKIPCSPFNGPGGSPMAQGNPYLVLNVSGIGQIGAREQLAPKQCPVQNNCTSTAVIDPTAYASPGQFYDTTGNLVGPQGNPFLLEPNVVFGFNPDHTSQYAQDSYGNVGMFYKRQFVNGSYWYKWVQCGTAGAGC